MELPEAGLLEKIRPPKLEDAGLEDCALPPDSIKEAFLKAAAAVRSIVSTSPEDDTEENCLNDPWPTVEGSSDALVGIDEGVDDVPGGCADKKSVRLPEAGSDDVITEGDDEKVDEVVVGGKSEPENEKACVDGLQGLEIGDKRDRPRDGDAGKDADEVDDEKPRLTEGFV